MICITDMHYQEYVIWFDSERNKLSLEPGCIEVGPLHQATASTKPPWKLDWCIRFADDKHIKIKERWWARSGRLGGMGYRKHFAFHYGGLNPATDAAGFPLPDSINFPPIIRIDADAYGPHLHYDGQDHVFQDRVDGFRISDAEIFDFVNAILQHRKTGEPLHKILKFSVTP